MQRPEPSLQMACHPFVGDAGAGSPSHCTCRGPARPLGSSQASHFKGPAMLNEAKLHNRWSEGAVGILSPSLLGFKLLQEDRVVPMPESFKNTLKLPTSCSPEPCPLGGGREDRNQTIQQNKVFRWANWGLPKIF